MIPEGKNEPIRLSKLLIVEGKEPQAFFDKLLIQIGMGSDVEVRDFGGTSEFRGFIDGLKNAPGFRSVKSMGIVRDAESREAKDAFKSICNGLKNFGFAVPDKPNEVINGVPRISVFILPDCQGRGMIETLILDAIRGETAYSCTEKYFACLRENGIDESRNMDKAKMQVYLASKPYPDKRLAYAIGKDYIDLTKQGFNPLRNFLISLFGEPS